MRKLILLGLISLLLLPLAQAKEPGRGPIQDFKSTTVFPKSIVAGSTYQVNYTFENVANIPVPVIPELNISSYYLSSELNISKGEFEVTSILNEDNLNCTDLSENYSYGLFKCYDGSEAYRVSGKSLNNLTLEYSSNPALKPGGYNFTLKLLAKIPFGYAPGRAREGNITKIVNTGKESINRTYDIPGFGRTDIGIEPNETWSYSRIEDENMTVLSSSGVNLTRTQYSPSARELGIDAGGEGLETIGVYSPLGRPTMVWFNDDLLSPANWSYEDNIITINVTFGSPDTITVSWFTAPAEGPEEEGPVAIRNISLSCPSLTITQGESGSSTLTVGNEGMELSDLVFSLEEGPSDWIDLPGSIEVLPSGETVDKGISVDVPEDAETGDHSITVGVSYGETMETCSFTLTVEEKTPTCPTCPEPSAWSKCEEGSQTRTNYICNAGTGYECKAVDEVRSCEIEVEECPSCPSPGDWSKCVNGSQERTNYRCSEETNYTCKAYTQTQSCSLCGNDYCEEGENYTTCSQDCPKPPARGAGGGITGKIIGSTAGKGAIVALVLILVGIIGVYWFKKNLR